MNSIANSKWIAGNQIKTVPGALKPSAYVGRAYRFAKQHDGVLPEWAIKDEHGQWLFERQHIDRTAKENLETVGMNEAARMLGASRKTIQNWVDEGRIPLAHGEEREKGAPRRIDRAAFTKLIPELKERLETAPVIAFKRKRGLPVPETCARVEDGGTGVPGTAQEAARELEEQLQRARQERKKDEDKAGIVAAREKKRRAARDLEKQLEKARADRIQQEKWESEATRIALRVMDDMFDDRINRIKAMDVYNKTATGCGVPDEVRIRIRKDFFGR